MFKKNQQRGSLCDSGVNYGPRRSAIGDDHRGQSFYERPTVAAKDYFFYESSYFRKRT